jgi:hypothetical protein
LSTHRGKPPIRQPRLGTPGLQQLIHLFPPADGFSLKHLLLRRLHCQYPLLHFLAGTSLGCQKGLLRLFISHSPTAAGFNLPLLHEEEISLKPLVPPHHPTPGCHPAALADPPPVSQSSFGNHPLLALLSGANLVTIKIPHHILMAFPVPFRGWGIRIQPLGPRRRATPRQAQAEKN